MKERGESTVGDQDEKLFSVFELHRVLVDYLMDAIQEEEEDRTFAVLTVVLRLGSRCSVVLLIVAVRFVALNQIKDSFFKLCIVTYVMVTYLIRFKSHTFSY